MSTRASACFAGDQTSTGRIEWIYHLLCSDLERGATELEKLDRDWSSRVHPEDRYALAAALRELEDTRIVEGRARAWALLAMSWARQMRGETAQLADVGSQVLLLARETRDHRAEADAQCLIGTTWEAQGKLEAAQATFAEYLAISRRLAEQDPSNAGWQRDLAVAHSRVGGVLQAQGKLEAVQAAYAEGLVIFRRLADQDPSNADRQRGLALACLRIARIEAGAGRNDTALPIYEESYRILAALVERAPGFGQWVEDKKILEEELAACRSQPSPLGAKDRLSWIQRLLRFSSR